MAIRKFYPRHDGGKESFGSRPHILREHDVALERVKIGDWETKKKKKKEKGKKESLCMYTVQICMYYISRYTAYLWY